MTVTCCPDVPVLEFDFIYVLTLKKRERERERERERNVLGAKGFYFAYICIMRNSFKVWVTNPSEFIRQPTVIIFKFNMGGITHIKVSTI